MWLTIPGTPWCFHVMPAQAPGIQGLRIMIFWIPDLAIYSIAHPECRALT